MSERDRAIIDLTNFAYRVGKAKRKDSVKSRKKLAKELIEFVTDNAREVLFRPQAKQIEMMNSTNLDVLRPNALPDEIYDMMTDSEFWEYSRQSRKFRRPSQIPSAIEWVRNWVKA